MTLYFSYAKAAASHCPLLSCSLRRIRMGAGQRRRSVLEGCIGGPVKKSLGEEGLPNIDQGVCSCCSSIRVSVSLTQHAIFMKVVEEEWPTQMCGHIIKSFNLSMPDRTRVCGQIIKGLSLSEPIYNLFLSLLHPSPQQYGLFLQVLQD